ncbi:DNA-processing protein DprA [Microbacterium hominis]|uniref:DNA-processing protein DprA n=1 Tax=Microbacterium hominis TaxID=162426 RepID=UPI00196549AF|nr:DNA-processing protein DprA [Microbacterium hominis]QRY40973.1 DNA-processing protein DprA [Microbacterium hominis]
MSAVPDAASARRALAGLVDDGLGDDDVRRIYATAVWSTLVEPGDGVAGALIRALGAVDALETALSTASAGAAATAAGIDHDDVRAARRRWQLRQAAVEGALSAARRARVTLLTPRDSSWPHRLDDLGVHAPLCLWVRGELAVADAEGAVAVVGARAATAYGVHVASGLSADCASDGITVVSGAAYGIDAAAHRAALRAGGATVAVLAGGVDRPYPAGHEDLISQIAVRGAVVAEVPCGSAPTKWRFLARNRLIAAMTDATVVVEAAHRSGALNTAHHAAALGRPLGAVPGPVTSAASAGCHRLLREADAVCVTGVADVLELLGRGGDAKLEVDPDRTDDRTRVLDALSSRSPRLLADIARRCGMAPEEVAALLGLLDLDGAVERRGGGWARRASSAPRR